MIPIGDDNSQRRSFPFVTYLFIAINVGVFILELQRGEAFIRQWAYIPVEFLRDPANEAVTLITSMFMHGGWGHLIGNMVYLWTFGDNVEDRLGHFGYILFYLVTGLAAIAAQTAFNPSSAIPNVGASGAIAGVLGAYILLFPRGQVRLLTQAGVIYLPALIAIGFWFVLQFTGIMGSIAETANTAETGGVAYMAHIGGFVAGFVLALMFARKTAAA
jgi:membrane associated rhomboid family serine protease